MKRKARKTNSALQCQCTVILLIAVFMTLMISSSECMTVQLNNIHNGYKYTIRGNPSPSSQKTATLQLLQVEVLQNTLPPQQNIKEVISTKGKQSKINLSQLEQITELLPDSEFIDVISTRWVKKPQYSVTFILEQQDDIHEMVFEMLRDHTIPYTEDL